MIVSLIITVYLTAVKEELCPACTSKKKESKLESPEEVDFKKPRVPKIWFGTRTHKQIAQITKELGRTFYK